MGNFWSVITGNYIINVGVVSWFSAQVIKTALTFFRFGELRLERLTGAGGMPSSHSALVCSMTLAMAKLEGFSSPLFGLTFAFAMVVMYDAMGVRRAAGEQAKVLNKIIFSEVFSEVFDLLNQEIDELADQEEPTDEVRQDGPADQKELKEYLGHTPLEVLGGMLLGILIASIMSPPTV